MRLARGSTAGAKRSAGGSPYRVAGVPRAEVRRGRRRPEVWALVFVLGCSLLRIGLFAFGSERFGPDPPLALALALGSAYTLCALARAEAR
jgi:hypothetical protein